MVVIVKLEFNRFSNELNSGLRDYHCSKIPSKLQGPSVTTKDSLLQPGHSHCVYSPVCMQERLPWVE